MTIEILAHEELPLLGKSSVLQTKMQNFMPWLSNQFFLAAQKSPPNISPMSPEVIEWQLKYQVLPNLLDQIKQSYIKKRKASISEGVPDEEVDAEDILTTQVHYAIALNLGLLAPAIAQARLALYELLETEYISIRTASALAIMYIGQTPPKMDQEGLMQAIETGVFFRIPLQMYIRILPLLKPIFQENSQLTQNLLDKFEKYIRYEGNFYTAETALFLAEIGVAEERVIDELLNWSEHFDFGPYHKQYCRRCYQTTARLMESNQLARHYVIQKIRDEALSTPVLEVDPWFKVLLEIDPQKITPEFLPELFDIANEMEKYVEFYVLTVQAVTNFVNVGSQQIEAEKWILDRLNSRSSDIITFTLRGIWGLKNFDNGIRQRVFDLAKGEDDRGFFQSPAIITIGQWRLIDKEAIEIVEKATHSNDHYIAKNAKQAMEHLKELL